MKTRSQLKIIGVVTLVFSLTSFSNFENLPTTNDSKFLIRIQSNDSGLKLKCETGCAWKELSFSLKDNKFQAVDQYGMTRVDRHKPSNDDKLANFLFVVQRTQDTINLEGKEGTAWTKLNFSCKDTECNQYIDQNGMTKKD